jgi:hypothetical protein
MELPELEAWQSKLQAQKDIVSGGGSVDEVRMISRSSYSIRGGV